MYGFIVCDISVPQHLRADMEDYLPMFCNSMLNMNDLGPVMREYAQSNNIKVENRRLLLSGMATRDITGHETGGLLSDTRSRSHKNIPMY